MTTKIASYIGLATRAGTVFFGEDIICEKRSKIRLVLIDSEAPEKYKERLKKRCDGVAIYEIQALQEATHRENVKAIAISNVGLADAIINLLR